MGEVIAQIIKIILELFVSEMSKPHTAEDASYEEVDAAIDAAIDRKLRTHGL